MAVLVAVGALIGLRPSKIGHKGAALGSKSIGHGFCLCSSSGGSDFGPCLASRVTPCLGGALLDCVSRDGGGVRSWALEGLRRADEAL